MKHETLGENKLKNGNNNNARQEVFSNLPVSGEKGLVFKEEFLREEGLDGRLWGFLKS